MKSYLFPVLIVLTVAGCSQSSTDYAYKWSMNIKSKILEDVSVAADSIRIDTLRGMKEVTLYYKDTRTKYFRILPQGDTIVSIFYSMDENFEIVRELCTGNNRRSFEGIRYKGQHVGLAEFRFCDGKLKEQGYRFNGNAGVWKQWDENGKVVQETDYGRTDQLKKLKTIRYYR
jgi:hypothetical protein